MADSKIRIKLPDGSQLELPKGITVSEAVKSIGAGLARAMVAARLDGQFIPLDESIQADAELEVITRSSDEGLDVLRHSTAHLMAYAVQELYPEAQFGFGPSGQDGFYYDIKVDRPFLPDDLGKIEKKMAELAAKDLPIRRELLTEGQAREVFADQKLKLEHIEDLEGEQLYAYRMGDFVDLCEGPHVASTREIKAYKLMSVAGAYWRNNENNEQLQRIHGTSWFDRKELKNYLHRLEEAKKRDHRKLGQQLDLYGIQDEAGGGLAFYYPRGSALRNALIDFWKQEHLKNGYELIDTPHISKADLWHTSGHMDFYRENMYTFDIEGQEYVVKPMNCPGHILIYKRKLWSYRELPVRYAELGTVYRYERSGTLHGMLRVRGFTQDDAHIFCTPEQLEEEVIGVLQLVRTILSASGMHEFEVELSVRDPKSTEKYAGSDEEWEMAEASLLKAILHEGFPYKRMEGEAVFYGPKIDVKLVDALGRKWQTSTVQFDFNLPRRFGVDFVDPSGERRHVYMVHRAIYGSLERFVGMLTEHYAGAFPIWMAPVQAKLLTVSEELQPYAEDVARQLRAAGIRVQIDGRNEKIGRKIREAEMEKVPMMLVIGAKERDQGSVALRRHGGKDEGSLGIEELLSLALDEIEKKS